MSGSLTQQFPSRNATWFDPKTGVMNPVAYQLMHSLWVRTGAGVADATANGLQSQITSQSVRIDTEAANIALNTTAISSLSTTVSTNYAPKASPILTGTPVVPGYVTTVFASATYLTIATAASTYLTTATAGTTYAPLASPTFTGAPVVPGYLTTATAGATYAPKASPAFTGTVTTPALSVTGTAATNALTASTTVLAGAGVGFFGHAAPGTQPGIPVTLADVIAALRGCGLTA